jgi:hypothetical protein
LLKKSVEQISIAKFTHGHRHRAGTQGKGQNLTGTGTKTGRTGTTGTQACRDRTQMDRNTYVQGRDTERLGERQGHRQTASDRVRDTDRQEHGHIRTEEDQKTEGQKRARRQTDTQTDRERDSDIDRQDRYTDG